MTKIGFISLGCPKNQIDGECLLASLYANGFEIADPYDGVDAVIINTCGFIESAKKEAIENILDMAQLKEDGVLDELAKKYSRKARFGHPLQLQLQFHHRRIQPPEFSYYFNSFLMIIAFSLGWK